MRNGGTGVARREAHDINSGLQARAGRQEITGGIVSLQAADGGGGVELAVIPDKDAERFGCFYVTDG